MDIRRLFIRLLIGAVLAASLAPAGVALAGPCSPDTEFTPADCRWRPRPVRPVRVGPSADPNGEDAIIPYVVAQVITASVKVYSDPVDFYTGLPPAREMGKGFLWVSILDETSMNGENWYRINEGEYVRSDQLALVNPSRFHGVVLAEQPTGAFGFVLTWVRPSLTAGGAVNVGVEALHRYALVTVFETASAGGLTWYRVGQDQWIPQTALGLVTVDERPARVGPNERWIEIDLYEQTLAAYEGDRLVYATLVSSGLKQWATDPGLFRIWAKLLRAPMSGQENKPDYYDLEDVPWIMYFNHDTALHGAYWHDRFGYPHSHGCVNLAPLDAKWLFDWTLPAWAGGNQKVAYPDSDHPGTWVWVH